jgi:hypothetical protein
MPAYVPEHEHDVFVSYAPLDDAADSGQGWVTTFMADLSTQLRRLLHSDDVSIFSGGEAPEASPLTRSAVLVGIVSPRSCRSIGWATQQEAFLGAAGAAPGAAERVFVVEHLSPSVADLPTALSAYRPYRLWVETGDGELSAPAARPLDRGDARYFEVIGDLVRAVSAQLRALRDRLQPSTSPAPGPPPSTAPRPVPVPPPDGGFDVFLCHNGDDKPAVKRIAEQLRDRGLRPWLDQEQLRPGFPWQVALEDQITQIRSAAVFVGKNDIGPWQERELRAFLQQFVERESPVIPVLLRDAPLKPDVPLFLKDFTWVDFRESEPDPMRQLIFGITGKQEVEDTRPAILLAEAGRDLAVECDGVRRFLDQAGFRTLPASPYPADPERFERALERDLATCVLFVQLLGDTADTAAPSLPPRYARLQYERARAAHVPVLQWRSPDLDPATVTARDPDHAALLDGIDVVVLELEAFKAEVHRRARRPPPLPPPPTNAFVFVNADRSDSAIAQELRKALDRWGVASGLPVWSAPPTDFRRDFTELLAMCHGLIVVYNTSPVTWVRAQLFQSQKRKGRPALADVAVYEGPSCQENVNLKLPPTLTFLDGRRGLNENQLRVFLAALASRTGQ